MYTDLRLHASLPAALEAVAVSPRGGEAGLHFQDGAAESAFLSYAQVRDGARKAAAFLRSRGVERGTPVVLALPLGPEFVHLLLGAQMAGGIPVPLEPPVAAGGWAEFFQRGDRIHERLGRAAHWALEAAALGALERDTPPARRPPREHTWAVDELRAAWPRLEPISVPEPHHVALILFGSGRGGPSRGATLTHRSVLANLEAIRRGTRATRADRVVSWLPPQQAWGLLFGLLFPLASGLPVALLPGSDFEVDPGTWLRALARFRGSMSMAPDWAYERAATAADAAQEASGPDAWLDLSGWRVALSGGEPVRPETLRRFVERFSPHGFRKTAFLPTYGLAEAGLAVSLAESGRPVQLSSVSRRALLTEGVVRARRAGEAPEDAWELASVGRGVHETELRVVGPDGEELPEERLGEIQVKGPGVMTGYFGDPEASEDVLSTDGWLSTGDLGFLAQPPGDRRRHLFVVGRIRELADPGSWEPVAPWATGS
jgi:acyl-CoA synthetase (AMP-forming)/AMP-acid ligase II